MMTSATHTAPEALNEPCRRCGLSSTRIVFRYANAPPDACLLHCNQCGAVEPSRAGWEWLELKGVVLDGDGARERIDQRVRLEAQRDAAEHDE